MQFVNDVISTYLDKERYLPNKLNASNCLLCPVLTETAKTLFLALLERKKIRLT